MRSSLRDRLLLTFLALVVIVGAGTLLAIEHALARDLTASLEARLRAQGAAVAGWLDAASDPAALAPRLAGATGARIAILEPDGRVRVDTGAPAGGAPAQFRVDVPAAGGRVIRLAVPLAEVHATRARMRGRLLVGAAFGLLGCVVLAWIFVRAVTRPLQSMTRTAARLAAGDYDAPPPVDAGGELGVLARAMSHVAGEVKARVGELTEQRDLLSVVIGGLVEGVVVVDPNGRVVLVNDAARPLVAGPEARAAGPAAGVAAIPAPLAPLVATALAGAPADAELALHGREVRASARPLGAPGAIVVLYDVTRLRALEAVRREFLANAAHELRTPVTAISGYAETLLAGGVDPATSREFLATIHRNAQRIARLVADLLVLDTLGGRPALVGERGPVRLAPVLADVVETCRGARPGAAAIHLEVPPDLAARGSREGIEHVAQNLVDNALKYGGGTPVRVRAHQVGDHVRLEVEDGGPGIPAGLEERVFERFFRASPGAAGGSGLGLALVRGWAEAMGGRAWVEPAAPAGARFVVELAATSAG